MRCAKWPQIHGNLREKEVTQRPYEGRSPFLSKRAEFIDWVHDVADKFRLRYTSAAAAIAYLDVCMDFYNSTIDFYGAAESFAGWPCHFAPIPRAHSAAGH